MTDKNQEKQESTVSSLDVLGQAETVAAPSSTFDLINPKTCSFKDCQIPLIGKDFSVGQRYCRLHLEEGTKRDAKEKAFNQRKFISVVIVLVFGPFAFSLLYVGALALFYGLIFAFDFLTKALGSPVAATILMLSVVAYLIFKAVSAYSRAAERRRIAKKEAQLAQLKAIEEKAIGNSEAKSSQDKAEPEKKEGDKDGDVDSKATDSTNNEGKD